MKPVYDTLPCNSGDKMKIQNVSCVEREGPWHTSYQDAKKHWLIEDVDGDMKNPAKVWWCADVVRRIEQPPDTKHTQLYILKFIVKD